MKHFFYTIAFLSAFLLIGCYQNQTDKKVSSNKEDKTLKNTQEQVIETHSNQLDKRISLNLNEKQKNHQLKNMRSHLEAIQTIVSLLASDNYEKASEIAYSKLGSTTEMKLMCASFGDENFEKLGLQFHESADKMSEIFKQKDKQKALKALSNTMNYCIQCHATYKQ